MKIWTGHILFFEQDETGAITQTTDFVVGSSLKYSSNESVMDVCEVKARTSPNFLNSLGIIQVCTAIFNEDGDRLNEEEEILELAWNNIPHLQLERSEEASKFLITPVAIPW